MKLGHANDLQSLFFDSDHGHPASDQATPVTSSNSAPPIHLLPTELLIKIFGVSIEPHEWSLAGIRNLAGVCRRWNSVIWSYPQLWAVINANESIKDINTAICMAKTHPLALILRYPARYFEWPALISVLASTSPELWSIDMEIPPQYLRKDWGAVSRLTPAVTHLRVHAIGYPSFPTPFLSIAQGRRLQLLDLSYVHVDWNNPRLSGLIVLRLHRLRSPITCSQLTRILQESPALEDVMLSSIELRPESEGELGTNDIIPLPSLKSFELLAADSCFNRLLPCLRIPASATVRLNESDISTLALGKDPVIFRIVPPALPSTPCIKARITKHGFSLVVQNPSSRWIRHTIHGVFGGISLLQPLQIGSCGPFITKLDVDMRSPMDRYPLESLERLCNLQSLRIHGGSWVQDVLNFLSRPLISEGGREVWPCPEITALDVGFRCLTKNDWMISHFLPEDGLVLQNLVSTRWGAPGLENGVSPAVARLACLKLQVPEALERKGDLDELLSVACKSARILGSSVVRILSTIQ